MPAFWGWVIALGSFFVVAIYLFIPHRNFGWQVDGKTPWVDTRSSGRNRPGDFQFESTRTNFGIPHASIEVTHPAGIRKPDLVSSVALEVRVPDGEGLHVHLDTITLTYSGDPAVPLAGSGDATVSFFGEGPFTWNGRAHGPGHHRGPLVLPLEIEIPKGNRSFGIYLPVHFAADVRKQKGLTEMLHLSAKVNGRAVEIHERFELRYVPHYTELDVLMGI